MVAESFIFDNFKQGGSDRGQKRIISLLEFL